MPFKREAIIWINDGLVYWRIYASLNAFLKKKGSFQGWWIIIYAFRKRLRESSHYLKILTIRGKVRTCKLEHFLICLMYTRRIINLCNPFLRQNFSNSFWKSGVITSQSQYGGIGRCCAPIKMQFKSPCDPYTLDSFQSLDWHTVGKHVQFSDRQNCYQVGTPLFWSSG